MLKKLEMMKINAEHDYITCIGCRSCVPQGQMCQCRERTKGPSVENITRKVAVRLRGRR